jgi:hypothetical protein
MRTRAADTTTLRQLCNSPPKGLLRSPRLLCSLPRADGVCRLLPVDPDRRGRHGHDRGGHQLPLRRPVHRRSVPVKRPVTPWDLTPCLHATRRRQSSVSSRSSGRPSLASMAADRSTSFRSPSSSPARLVAASQPRLAHSSPAASYRPLVRLLFLQGAQRALTLVHRTRSTDAWPLRLSP